MLAGNDNIHESLDEFEIQSDLIRDHRVSCSLASEKWMLPLFLVSQLWLYLGNSQVSVYRTIGPLVLAIKLKFDCFVGMETLEISRLLGAYMSFSLTFMNSLVR